MTANFQGMDFLAVLAVVLMGGFAMWRFGAKSSSAMPEAGQAAPEFTLPRQNGAPVTLSNYRGQWVVLYFYPKDMTTGCSIEARHFQRDLEKYEARNTVILGVSLDTVESHEKFCAKDGLHFTLLSDRDGMQVSKAYGALANYFGLKVVRRITFLIDPDGKVAKVWTGVNPMRHSGQVLEELEQRKA